METRRRGFTLIEVVISTVILVIMILALMGSFESAQEACSLGAANLTLQTTNTNCMNQLARQLRAAKIVNYDTVNGSWIQFQVPVDWDRNKSILNDATLAVEWGAGGTHGSSDTADAGGRLGYIYCYRYVRERDFVEAEEGAAGTDLNRDGTKLRTFELGYIEEQILDDAGAVVSARPISPACVVGAANYGWDVNNDGVADPIFARVNDEGEIAQNGLNIRISFYSFKRTRNGRTLLLHPTTIVACRAVKQ